MNIDDPPATGKSWCRPVEAWWKQKGENCCAIPTIPANTAARLVLRNCRKSRNLSQFSVIVHGSFATTHNLKAAGSNPAPATKLSRVISNLQSAPRGAFCIAISPGSTAEARGCEVFGNKAKTAWASVGWPLLARRLLSTTGRERPKVAGWFGRGLLCSLPEAVHQACHEETDPQVGSRQNLLADCPTIGEEMSWKNPTGTGTPVPCRVHPSSNARLRR